MRQNRMEGTENNQQPQAPAAAPAPEATPAAPKATVADVKGMLGQLEAWLGDVMIKKAPFQIPMGGKNFLAMVAPYLVILGIVFAIPATLLVLVLSPFAILGGGGMVIVSFLFSIAALVIEAIALPGLFKRTQSSWRLLFYASVVSVAGSVVSLQIVSAIIGAVIGWYIIFQVKEVYKN